MKQFSFLFIVISALQFYTGCKKNIETAPPVDQVVSSEVFKDDKTAVAALNGLYSQMMLINLEITNGSLSVYPALSADELVNTSPNANNDVFANNAIPATQNSQIFTGLWRYAYSHIYHANAILEGAEASGAALTPALEQQLKGEARFARALCYFYLVNLFGDVPLLLTTDYTSNAVAPRSNETAIYGQVVKDLKEAQQLLTDAYPTAGRVRPNKATATALLARVYLYMQNWADAEVQASILINIVSLYSLAANPDNVFLANSTETIWQLQPVQPFFNTAEGSAFVPSASASSKPAFVLTAGLLNAFEPNDLRRSSWVGVKTVSSVAYYYPFKYKINSNSTVTEYNMVLRLAEQYLIRAEARAQQNNIAGAVEDINVIRQRAQLPLLSSSLSQTDCLLAIEKERRIELFAEWGHRWFDLKRTGRITTVLSAVKTSWQPSAALYPIPQSELDKNPFLTQNPGY